MAYSLLLLYVPALLSSETKLRGNVVAKVELLLLRQIMRPLQMLYCFIERFQLHQAETEEEVALDEIGIHIQCTPTIAASSLPALHLYVAQGTVREVGGIGGVFDLEISNQLTNATMQ